MNIQSLLPNLKGRNINRKNSDILERSYNDLPDLIIGKNGTVKEDIHDISKKINRCSDSLTMGTVTGRDGSKESKILEVRRCGQHKLCPVCSDKVSGDRMRKIDESLVKNWDSIKNAYMITFTIKDSFDLYDRLELLKLGWRKWYQKGRNRSKLETGHSNGEAFKILGASKSIEVVLGRGNPEDETAEKKWHPHMHIIVFTSEPIDFRTYRPEKVKQARELFPNKRDPEEVRQYKKWLLENDGYIYPYEINGKIKAGSKLTKEWHEATFHNGEIQGENVDCSPIFTSNENDFYPTKPLAFQSMFTLFEKLKGKEDYEIKYSAELSVIKSVKYALKYSVKPNELEKMKSEQVFTLFDALKKTRTIEYKGFLYGSGEPVQKIDAELSKELILMSLDEESLQKLDIDNISNLEELERLKKEQERRERERAYQEWCEQAVIVEHRTPAKFEDDYLSYHNMRAEEMQEELKTISGEKVLQLYDDAENGCVKSIKHIDRLFNSPQNLEPIEETLKMSVGGQYVAHNYYENPEALIGAPVTQTAVFQLGADYHLQFKRETAERVVEYRAERKLLWDQYSGAGFLKQFKEVKLKYIRGLELAKKRMKKDVKRLKKQRDERINERTNGKFKDIIRNTHPKRGKMSWLDLALIHTSMVQKDTTVELKSEFGVNMQMDSSGKITQNGF